jgi:hypothetical protein
VEVLQRQYELVDGQPSGEVTERQVAVWTASGFEALAPYEGRDEDAEAGIVAEALAAGREGGS